VPDASPMTEHLSAAHEPEAERTSPSGPLPKPAGEDDLLGLDAAILRVPEPLRREMEEQLRAEFREVIRWKDANVSQNSG